MPTAYDAVVIGAGANGLTLALYLQRAGLSTVVLEAASRVGGMARTETPLLPGYRHNPHANFLSYGAISPVERDFDLARHGLATVTPEAQHGLAFQDGRPPLVLYRNDLAERSVSSLSVGSQADAATYAALKAAAGALDPVIAQGIYAPANRDHAERQIEAAVRVAAAVGMDGVGGRSAAALIQALFEADETRALFLQLSAETGLQIDAPGGDIGFLTLTLWLIGQWRLPLGGMQAYADALAGAALSEGVTIATGSKVERILVRAGQAKGVIVAGQGQVVARRLVASSAGLAETLLDMAPRATLRPAEARSLQTYRETEGPGLGSLVACLSQAPSYRSARWNPDINRCFRTMVGPDTAAEVLANLRTIDAGGLPVAGGALRINSLWDRSQAPGDGHVAGADVLMPAPRNLSAEDWAIVREGFPEAFRQAWARAAPNITAESILAVGFEPPHRYDRAIRLREGTAQYRTEVERLYLCGASTYPGGGVHGGCGYNAFAAIREDLRLSASGCA